ncbi:hypothetical protein A2U01_0007306, partial [Trifolium medium]|nr:hypothetical protein [Trifolium medium]
MPPRPEKKIFFAAPLQDEDSYFDRDLSRNVPSKDK